MPVEVAEPSARDSSVQSSRYRRVPCTSSRCLIFGCQNTTRRRLPSSLRANVLCKYNIYIPKDSRVCQEHLISFDWEQLQEAPNLCTDFSGAYLDDIIDVLKEERSSFLDFVNYRQMSQT